MIIPLRCQSPEESSFATETKLDNSNNNKRQAMLNGGRLQVKRVSYVWSLLGNFKLKTLAQNNTLNPEKRRKEKKCF